MNRRAFWLGSAVGVLGFGLALTGCGGGSPASPPALSEAITRSPSERAGMQLILLPFWSSKGSVVNFLNTFKDGRGNYTGGPQKLAISFAPYLYGPGDSYGNARTILNALISGGKDISVTVFLDRSNYHRGGTGADGEIETSAADFNRFLREYAGKVALSVCPSLEDRASRADIDRWAAKIAARLDRNYIKYVAFRRNPENVNDKYLPAQGSYRAVQLELHGQVNSQTVSGAAYSNDGTFVGNGNETLEGSGPRYSVGSFASSIRSNRFGGTVLFWRPAYNVFKRENRNGKINFTRTGRDLSDAQISFDAAESRILKEFFGS